MTKIQFAFALLGLVGILAAAFLFVFLALYWVFGSWVIPLIITFVMFIFSVAATYFTSRKLTQHKNSN